jgi:hypothetical protein
LEHFTIIFSKPWKKITAFFQGLETAANRRGQSIFHFIMAAVA